MGQVVRFFDGILAPIGCVSSSDYGPARRSAFCRCFRRVLLDIRNFTTQLMDKATLASVLRGESRSAARKSSPPGTAFSKSVRSGSFPDQDFANKLHAGGSSFPSTARAAEGDERDDPGLPVPPAPCPFVSLITDDGIRFHALSTAGPPRRPARPSGPGRHFRWPLAHGAEPALVANAAAELRTRRRSPRRRRPDGQRRQDRAAGRGEDADCRRAARPGGASPTAVVTDPTVRTRVEGAIRNRIELNQLVIRLDDPQPEIRAAAEEGHPATRARRTLAHLPDTEILQTPEGRAAAEQVRVEITRRNALHPPC